MSLRFDRSFGFPVLSGYCHMMPTQARIGVAAFHFDRIIGETVSMVAMAVCGRVIKAPPQLSSGEIDLPMLCFFLAAEFQLATPFPSMCCFQL